MSTTLTADASAAAPESPATAVRRGSRTAAVLALARFETRELLLRIPVIGFGLLFVGLTVYDVIAHRDGMDAFPALQDADRDTQSLPLLLALALLVCVNRAALRPRRHHNTEQVDALVVEPWRRTLGHALSVVPVALLTAVVVLAEFTTKALFPGAVGHGSAAELAVGPLVVLAAGATGVLLARLFPTPLAPVLFVVVVCAVPVIGVPATGGPVWMEWITPVQQQLGVVTLPSGLLGRPAGWHALYLGGLAALLLCVALLRAGGRTRVIGAATVLALAATAVGVAGQSRGIPDSVTAARRTAARTPERVQSCVTSAGSTYCSFPEWTARRADWAAVVRRVQGSAGGEAAGRTLTVRQRVAEVTDLTSDDYLAPQTVRDRVTVGTRWGGNRVPEFAVGVAAVLVAGDEKDGGALCGAPAVTAVWLALAKDPAPLDSFRAVRLDDSLRGGATILAPTEPLFLSARQTAVVREALRQPYGTTAARVRAHWTELTTPGTTAARAARLLGVAVPRGADRCE